MGRSMSKVNFTLVFIILLFSFGKNRGQDFDLYLIDSYVTPEKPHTFILTFFTSEDVKTKLVINDNYKITVSDEYLSDHSAEIDFTDYSFPAKFVPFVIISEKRNGEVIQSEVFEVVLPYEEFVETKKGSDPVSTILFGVFLYLLPSPNLILHDSDNFFSLTKEFPLITFYSSGYTNPSGNISIEYTHVYDSGIDNYLRFGYKHFIPIGGIEYISPGITGFTNFNGFNGFGGEVSLGLFNIYDVFTLYTRYRYNFKPDESGLYFHEISIGLYSHFFTIDL